MQTQTCCGDSERREKALGLSASFPSGLDMPAREQWAPPRLNCIPCPVLTGSAQRKLRPGRQAPEANGWNSFTVQPRELHDMESDAPALRFFLRLAAGSGADQSRSLSKPPSVKYLRYCDDSDCLTLCILRKGREYHREAGGGRLGAARFAFSEGVPRRWCREVPPPEAPLSRMSQAMTPDVICSRSGGSTWSTNRTLDDARTICTKQKTKDGTFKEIT